MKNKILYLLLSLTLASLSLFSQQCSDDSLTKYPSGDINYTGQGFADPTMIPCVMSGAYMELLIPYKIYNQGARLLTLPDSSTIPVTNVYSIKVENITNLPLGFCWTTRPSSGIAQGDQAGGIVIKGTTSIPTGIYPLSVSISIDIQGNGSYTYTGLLPNNYKSLLGQVVLRVLDSNYHCPDLF